MTLQSWFSCDAEKICSLSGVFLRCVVYQQQTISCTRASVDIPICMVQACVFRFHYLGLMSSYLLSKLIPSEVPGFQWAHNQHENFFSLTNIIKDSISLNLSFVSMSGSITSCKCISVNVSLLVSMDEIHLDSIIFCKFLNLKHSENAGV